MEHRLVSFVLIGGNPIRVYSNGHKVSFGWKSMPLLNLLNNNWVAFAIR
jgi:hypothetical protein